MAGYWEWWSVPSGNLVADFDSYDELIEAVADYVALHGWAAGKSVIEDCALYVNRDNPTEEYTLDGPELLRAACRYG